MQIKVVFINAALLCSQRKLVAVHKRHLLVESESASHSDHLRFRLDMFYVVKFHET